MRKKYYHRKLIRDRIPEIIEKNGDEFAVRVLEEKEFEQELRKKVLEEAKELATAPKEKLLNELADVLQIIKSLASYYKIDFEAVQKYQVRKKRERGAFEKRLFLLWSTGKAGK